MGEDGLHDSLRDLINAINSYDNISSAALSNAMFPDDLILAIHNHLGNINQLVSSASEAFNGAEQEIAYASAQKELEALSASLFSARQTGLISENIYNSINQKVHNIINSISDLMDPDYV